MKTMSIRMDDENFEFLMDFSKKEKEDMSKAVRQLVLQGRVMLAVEKYKKGEASLGKAAELAGMPIGQMMNVLAEFNVKNNIEYEDYLQGYEHAAKW